MSLQATLTTALLAGAAIFAPVANALNPVEVVNQDFQDSVTKTRFEIIGVDYQPGGSSGFTGNGDPLSDPTACLRDAVLMQQLGVNTLRCYNVDPLANHDECVSIFNEAGIYMIIDVNSPFAGGSINQDDPAPSYTTEYLNRTFLVIDAFREYPNLIGFFAANELINNDQNAGPDPPYIRAVQRDMKMYIQARGGRAPPVGYSAAQVQDVLQDTNYYLQCQINGQSNDISRSDFFGLNSYSWCGQSSFTQSGYNTLVEWFQNSTIPVFFSEYGCNKVLPRTFQEVGTLYGPQMTSLSGGLVYQWTQDVNNYGLVQVNPDNTAQLLGDYTALQTQYNQLNISLLMAQNTTAQTLPIPSCNAANIINPMFNTSWDLPPTPSGALSLISNGAGGPTGSLTSVTATQVTVAVSSSNGAVIPSQSLVLQAVSSANVPGGATSTSGPKKSAAAPAFTDPRAAFFWAVGLIGGAALLF